MIRRLSRWLGSRDPEMVVSIALVLLCFLVFLGILAWKFPEGTRLTDLIKGDVSRGPSREESRELELDIGDFGEKEFVAVLSSIENKVKDRPRGEIAWQDSRSGQKLGHRQAVQTFRDSKATISFDEGHVLQLSENSLVVVRNTGSLTEDRRPRRALVVLGGRLDGKVAAEEEETLSVELVASNGESRIRPRATREKPAAFTAVVGENEETTLSIHEGEAEIVSGDRTVLVTASHSVTMTKDREVSEPVPLPSPPELVAPASGYSARYGSRPPEIRFSWRKSSGSERYQISVARDPEFRDVVYDGEVEGTELTHPSLREGGYYWRVRGARAGAVGRASGTRRLSLASDRVAPDLDLALPSGIVDAPEVVVKGSTDPGARVFVADRRVLVDPSGRFEHVVSLVRGANMIVVEAVDESGNTTYRSELIHARY